MEIHLLFRALNDEDKSHILLNIFLVLTAAPIQGGDHLDDLQLQQTDRTTGRQGFCYVTEEYIATLAIE